MPSSRSGSEQVISQVAAMRHLPDRTKDQLDENTLHAANFRRWSPDTKTSGVVADRAASGRGPGGLGTRRRAIFLSLPAVLAVKFCFMVSQLMFRFRRAEVRTGKADAAAHLGT